MQWRSNACRDVEADAGQNDKGQEWWWAIMCWNVRVVVVVK